MNQEEINAGMNQEEINAGMNQEDINADLEQEEANAAYSQGREYIEDLFKDGQPVEREFMWGVFDSIAIIITDCGLEDAFNKSLEWAKGGGDDEENREC